MNGPDARAHDAASLLRAAAEGWFIAADAFVLEPAGDDGAPLARGRFEQRGYTVRPARADDLPALARLEAQCWPEGLGVAEDVLRARIERHPAGQLVLECGQDGRMEIAAAVYSQRIARLRQLQGLQAREVEALHRPDGAIVQLLAVNVAPRLQDRAFGDQLLELMLQLCALLPGVEAVVGVTRCKDYPRHAGMPYDAYAALRNAQGSLADPILRFHEAHGATIRGPMPNYRPGDRANRGYGVLVHYAIRARRPAARLQPAPVAARGEAAAQPLVAEAVAAVLGLSAAQVPAEAPLFELGLDSAGLLDLRERLAAALGAELEPAFFFEFNTVGKIARQIEARRAPAAPPARATAVQEPAPAAGPSASTVEPAAAAPRDIAIVGMALRLPGGDADLEDADAFWRFLSGGGDAIRELPDGRWTWPADVDPRGAQRGIARGGFLRDIAGFDAAFFRISPREAELMDPQQRMLLELSWACLEDAGHAPASLAGSRTGVYVGASGSDYAQLLKEDGRAVEAQSGIGGAVAILANRISYFHDLRGPSVQVDTACSSSLVALHQAVQALRAGGCEQALVAGIHVMCHPANSIAYHRAGMLSPDGRCATFDAAANGYVRGEGAVMLLLKPLARALADGDRIHALVKGTAVNHGGRAGGLTVPNPASQAELLRAALADAGVDAASIDYVEAHGTGTALGDPIEVRALKEAFADADAARARCGLGSVKTQLGHLEAAAGLAGLAKVVLAMRHATLPPSLHFKRLNPHIALQGSPFHVVDRLAPWTAPPGTPRRAGISSFGSGGTNAHAVLQEHPAPARAAAPAAGPFVFPLSARTMDGLKLQARRLAAALDGFGDADLGDIAFTLQAGRDAMPARLGCTAASIAQLREQLEGFAQGRAGAGLQLGEVRRDAAVLAELAQDDDMAGTLAAWAAKGRHARLLALWVQGLDLDWPRLLGTAGARRVGLPTYPFAREPYWLPARAPLPQPQAALHPLAQRNTSTLDGQRFSARLDGSESFLAGHRVRGERVLPAAAQLEMVCAAARLSVDDAGLRGAPLALRNLVFARPVTVGAQPLELHARLWPQEDGEIGFAIASDGDGGEETVHARGSVSFGMDGADATLLDLASLRAACATAMDVDGLYRAFAAMGFGYGPAHRGIVQLALGDGQLLARIDLPAAAADARHGLHPGKLDAVLQAANALALQDGGDAPPSAPLLPFALDAMELLAAPAPGPWLAWVRAGTTGGAPRLRKSDIDVCDAQGTVWLRLRGYAARRMDEGERARAELLQPVWLPQAMDAAPADVPAAHAVVLAPGHARHAEELKRALGLRHCLALPGGGPLDQRYTESAAQLLELVRALLGDPAPGAVLLQLVLPDQGEDAPYRGLLGLLQSARLENPRLAAQCIACPPETDAAALARLLRAEAHSADIQVRHRDGLREVLQWQPAAPTGDADGGGLPLWQDHGIHLITGGLGGLGWLLAQEIARRATAPVLLLAGRSPLDAPRERQLQALRAAGAQAEYHALDLADAAAVDALMRGVAARFGRLDCVVHAAGVLRDGYLLRKTGEDLRAVLAPKVAGLLNLERACRPLAPRALLLFSSVVAVLGNAGQADYAAANGFLDAYADWRARDAAEGAPPCRVLALDWPLWAEGGMRVEGEALARLRAAWGAPLASAQGLDALQRAWDLGAPQVAVFTGGLQRWQAALRRGAPVAAGRPASSAQPASPAPSAPSLPAPAAPGAGLEDIALRHLKQVLAEALKLAPGRVDADAPLEQYGFDSFLALRLTEALEKDFGSLSKTLFFEYQTLRALAGHFAQAHAQRVAGLAGGAAAARPAAAPSASAALAAAEPAIATRPATATLPARHGRARAGSRVQHEEPASGALDIAIVGLAGRYPQARDLRAFWRNLREGRDCITGIPPERWDHDRYFHPDKEHAGTSYSRWGGFIDGVDEFDPLFFNIPPREAALIDPQERLFAQCAWEALEDAGYTRERLARQRRAGLDGSVGVFVGVMYEEYQLYGAQEQARGRNVALFGSPSSIANRVSYFCNLHGPSMAVDTMCSSSLTAIHLACQSLREGACEMAIAGGVNVSIHPNKYLFLARGRFISSKGRCESFGEGGDGYVPGEGVGAVLLKPLSKAIADGDRIYGVIKGSAVNHGGKTNGYSVPNPVAQAAVIRQAMERAGVHPRAVSYIEAHGTGTSLGDPIEIAGLARAFADGTEERQFCAIGSAKSNIGHCESAAGIAGLTKVLLQLQHGQIAPSLHAEVLNPHIDFAATPFRVQQELAEWKRPIASIDGAPARELPRIAGISSFGAGGSNAHVVIEEYVAPPAQPIAVTPERPAVIVLSARDAERLTEHARNLLQAIEDDALDDADLADLAYTLQAGREAMEERLAFAATSMAEAKDLLHRFVAGDTHTEGLFRGSVRAGREALAALAADAEHRLRIAAWIADSRSAELAQAWARGAPLDWSALHAEATRPRMLSLPTYPFARERHWLQLGEAPAAALAPVAPAAPQPVQRAQRLLVKAWEPCPVVPAAPQARHAAILVDAGTRALGERLAGRFARTWLIDAAQPDTQVDWAQCDAWIDLVGCGHVRDDGLAWIVPLQRLIEHGPRSGLLVLGVTRGLEAEPDGAARNLAGATRAGLYRMLQSEVPRLRARHADIDAGLDDEALIEAVAAELADAGEEPQVRHRRGLRERALLREAALPPAGAVAPLADGVLWITGGTRGIGMACARHLVQRHGARRLVLSGREAFPPREQWDALAAQDTPLARKLRDVLALEAAGARVHLSDVDLTDEQALRDEIALVRKELGPVAALIHSAGLVDNDRPALLRKTPAGMARVLAPKVQGLETLLRCLPAQDLRWAVLFSSVAAAIPSLGAGHADYAMANASMDYRALAHEGPFPLIAIQWPSWKEAGFGEIRSPAYRATGLLAHTNAEGLELLDRLLAAGRSGSWLPAVVDPARWNPDALMRRSLLQAAAPQPARQAAPPAAPSVQPPGHDWLRALLAEQLGMEPARLDSETPLLEYGMDSVLMLQFLRGVGSRVGAELDPSILFEHSTLQAFGDWLRATHGDAARAADAQTEPAAQAASTALTAPTPSSAPARTPALARNPERAMAVVGMACAFPGAPDLDAYWSLLSEGRSALRRVPPERWGGGEARHAGLLDDIGRFDPGYFLLSEADARAMDPQALLVLEQALQLIYHAGCTPRELKGRPVGVYLGARSRHQPDAAHLAAAEHPILSIGQNYLAANVSRFFDLRGPSLVVDTACSSALVAMHMAVQALQAGEIEAALVGGVNLLVTDEPLRVFAQRGILQPEPAFHLFDARARGAVLGEGAGLVLLKPLARALAEGDRVYAVLRGIAVNNDGRTASPVAPSMQAQMEVMRTALAASGLRAGDIAHVEANGSGSPVTDLLELKAIQSVYRADNAAPCSLGSVKPNIGHPLCAEGIAGFIKLALMLHHGRTVPFLSAQQPLAHYDFAASPLFFQRASAPWAGTPRAAALNCFGDGGTNAHVVLAQAPEGHAPLRAPLAPPRLARIALHAPARTPAPSPEEEAAQPVEAAGFWGRLTVSHS